MMGRTSKQEAKEGTEVAEGGKPMSGAYIRSLVKQLTSSTATRKSRDPDETPQQEEPVSETPPLPPHKKQVRRRLHTTRRPYQERLLNMAEARREIVTALKFHRAAMKQAQEQEDKQYHRQQHPPTPSPPTQPMAPNYSNYHQFDASSIPFSPLFPYPPPHNPNIPSNQNPYPWPISPISPLPSSSAVDSLAIALPSQTLGLNLNLQDFDNLYHNGSTTPPSIYSTSSPPAPSTSSSSTSSVMMVSQEAVGPAAMVAAAADDQNMAVEEMRTLGERHQMEWNDRMNLVTSAWWFEFVKGADQDGDQDAIKRAAEECCGFQTFDEVMEFPPWLGGGESCLQPHLVDGCFSSDVYFQDSAALPCMDIGEIDAIDGEWFS